MNPFSSVMNAINRDLMKNPINILSFTTHEGFQNSMAMGNLCRYTHVPNPEGKKWDEDYRVMPRNIIEVDSVTKALNIDVVLSHTLNQRGIASDISRALNVKHIFLNHIFPDRSWADHMIKSCKEDNNADVTVFTTAEQRDMWNYSESDSIIIPHGINTNIYQGHNPVSMRILTAANYYKERGKELGYDFYTDLKELINDEEMFLHVGKSSDGSSKAHEEIDLIQIYQSSGVFLNTAIRSVLPTTLLEAMSVGMPVVTTRNKTIEKLVVHEYNGYVVDTPEEAMVAIESIMNDKDLAQQLGKNASDTIERHYNINSFGSRWVNLFKEMAHA